MNKNKDIVLEGVLVSISNNDPMRLSYFIELANKYKYKTIIISLVADDKIRKQRQVKRGNTLLARTDNKLVKAHSLLNSTIDSYQIDTSKLSIKKSLKEIERIIHK